MDEVTSWFTTGLTAKLIFGTLIGFLIYLMGSQNISAFSAVVCLGGIDFITAMYVLAKQKKCISSRKLPRKLVGISIYAMIIMTMNLLTMVNKDFALLVDIAIGWCATSEALSILEHISTLGYKVPVKLLNNLTKE